jgi:hypothetical protein
MCTCTHVHMHVSLNSRFGEARRFQRVARATHHARLVITPYNPPCVLTTILVVPSRHTPRPHAVSNVRNEEAFRECEKMITVEPPNPASISGGVITASAARK